MPRLLLWSLRYPPVDMRATPFGVLLPAAGLLALAGAFSLGLEGAGWIFALLVLSAAVTAIAQQTLP